MKRYCKGGDITDVKFIKGCILECFDEKWTRNEVKQLLSEYGHMPFDEVTALVKAHNYSAFDNAVESLAKAISAAVTARDITIPPVVCFSRYDPNSGKTRDIVKQSMLHQIYDYMAVDGLDELLRKKLGATQFACIKGRGQTSGKDKIVKWVKNDSAGTKYFVKCDIRKCYPSIPHDKLKQRLHRDVKNPTLLWLVDTLIDVNDNGLSIGSYLSANLCNYYLSRVWHYAYESTGGTVRRGKRYKRVRHVIMYMDDVLLFGANKRELKRAFYMIDKYIRNELGLEFKPTWVLRQTSKCDIDMMGFKVCRGQNKSTQCCLRRKTFLRVERTARHILKRVRLHRGVHINTARLAMSYYGLILHGGLRMWYMRYKRAFTTARTVISNYSKQGGLDYEITI